MVKGRKIRDKGKTRLSQFYKKIADGSVVAVVKDAGAQMAFPKRIAGKSGKVIGSRGSHKIIELNDGDKKKVFIIHPMHLRVL